jgi:hypothetical protein
MKRIPLRAVPSQSLSVVLAGQNCQISVYEKSGAVYLDLLISHAPIITTTLCHDRVCLVRSSYLGFVGDLAFIDLQGSDDPSFDGLGSRFVLVYLEASEL